MSIFAERLTILMNKHGLNQSQLASKAKITESAMSNYIKGIRTPNSEVLLRIADALDTSTDYLLGKSNIDPNNEELRYIQRNLNKLNPQQLEKAKKMLRTVFDELIKEKKDILCKSFNSASKHGVDMHDFGSDSAVLVSLGSRHIIFFDETKPVSHINFSIIHELGHFELKHSNEKYVNQELYVKQEIEANYFTAQVLMPEQLLRHLQKQGVKLSTQFLMENFGVSKLAAEKRLITLAKTNTEWRSRSESEFDDIILIKYLPLIHHLCPKGVIDFEKEYELQQNRDTWN